MESYYPSTGSGSILRSEPIQVIFSESVIKFGTDLSTSSLPNGSPILLHVGCRPIVNRQHCCALVLRRGLTFRIWSMEMGYDIHT